MQHRKHLAGLEAYAQAGTATPAGAHHCTPPYLTRGLGMLLFFLGAQPLQAAESFQATSLSLGYSFNAKEDVLYGTGTSNNKAVVGQFEHFSTWGYGDNYFDFEAYHGKNIGDIPALSSHGVNAGSFGSSTSQTYLAIYNGRLSAGRLSGRSLAWGPVKDLYAAARLEGSNYANYRAAMLGLSVDLDVPGASFFETDLYIRSAQFTGNTNAAPNLFSRTYAVFPFRINGMNLSWQPLLLLNFRRGGRGTEVYFRPDLWVDIPGTSLSLGFRPDVHLFGKLPSEGGGRYRRITPTFLARWTF